MNDEYFRATGAYETVQRLADLVSMTLQIDDVQDFDVRWDHALLSVSEMPSDPILEGLYKSKLPNSGQLRTVMALYDQEVARDNGTPNCQQLNTAVKHHIYQMMRNRWKGCQSPRVTKETKPTWKGKWKSVFSGRHKDNVPKETRVVSVMSHDLLEIKAEKAKDKKVRSSSPASHSKSEQTDGKGENLTGIRQQRGDASSGVAQASTGARVSRMLTGVGVVSVSVVPWASGPLRL